MNLSPHPTEFKWGTFTELDTDGDLRSVHVAPLFGREHVCVADCWCHPERDLYCVVTHNVMH